MNIGIVGMGVLGNAMYEGFQSKGHHLYVNDIKEIPYHIHTLEELTEECEIIFICVPTPQMEDGACNLSIVYEVFNQMHFKIAQLMKDEDYIPPIIAVSSTVIPGTVDSLSAMYPFVASTPEFLTEKNALRDFLNPDRIVVGSKNNRVTQKMRLLYDDFDTTKFFVTPTEAEAIKYLSNSLLLTKVAFSQEISKLCQALRLNARMVYNGITADSRVDPHHLDPTVGRVSPHTPCLSKDMYALITQMDKSGMDTTFLKAAYATAVDGVRLEPELKIKEDYR